MVLKLEEMVEMLQDRRRKVDRTIRLQLQQVKDNIMNCKKEEESRQASSLPFELECVLQRRHRADKSPVHSRSATALNNDTDTQHGSYTLLIHVVGQRFT